MIRPLALAALASLVLTTGYSPAATAASPSTLTAQENDELTASYAHLVADFYKKVDTKAAVENARQEILNALKAAKIDGASLPALKTTGDEVGDAHELQREVQTAVSKYGAKAGSTKITYAAISGVLKSVNDRYTTFLTPEQYAELNQGLDGSSFGGVGLSYNIDETTHDIRVENVIPDGPADKAGLQGDDHVAAIDGKKITEIIAGATDDQKTTRIQKLLRGNPGTKVQLTVVRDGKPLAPITVTRDTIHTPSVYAKMLPNGIGYAQISVFGQTTGQELTSALNRLDSQGAKAFVLDLRSNGGGYLAAAIDVSSKFISSGPIVTVESRAGANTEYDAENTAVAPRPLAVLVNAYTASASEITAGAIQDSGVGTIVGTKTFGKGVVQTIFPLRDGAAVKITTARYITPAGRDINGIGITPQIVAEIPKGTKIRPGTPDNDPQLKAALGYIDGKLASNGGTISAKASNDVNGTPRSSK